MAERLLETCCPYRADHRPYRAGHTTEQYRADHTREQSRPYRAHYRSHYKVCIGSPQTTLESTQQSTAAYTAKNVHNRTLQSTAAYSTEYFRGSESEHTVEHSRAPRSTGRSIPEKHRRAHCFPHIGGTVCIAAHWAVPSAHT